ncbi:uncharacterized protein LOC127863388 [Dreissena polymorpha]|uniref:uncharacterized protein LOC127863388 n=1 Tax=Dreissena polymorpha TaxID=45954 RepID=UPI002263DED4|nr:uncharacterized protein LOC127863388 [Dreissena polymorpha]
MATITRSSVYKGSDIMLDYSCMPCEEKGFSKEAEVYCEKCTTFYCGSCLNLHNQLYKTHTRYERSDMKDWPLAMATRDCVEKCEVHMDEKLKLFCEDHEKLCCNTCISLNHRQCAKVSLITDLVNITSPGDLQQLFDDIKTIKQELKELRKSREENIASLQDSLKKSKQCITDVRDKINAALDELEKMTMAELDFSFANLKTDFKKDVDNCNKLYEELKGFRDTIHEIGVNNNELVFVANQKWLEKKKQSESYIQELSGKPGISLSLQVNTNIEKYLSELHGLGIIIHTDLVTSYRALSVIGKTEFSVHSNDDTYLCSISGVCFLPDSQIVLTDYSNASLKLLNQKYEVISRTPLVTHAHDICHVCPSEVAITLNKQATHEVQLFTVDKGRLIKGRTYRLEHQCIGISHLLGELYITSGSALYKYSLRGELIKKLYEDISHEYSVLKCALSHNGDRIFVTDRGNNKLLTLAKDGDVLFTFSDPDMQVPWNVHVSAAGHILVCGYESRTVIQVDSRGRRKIATLARDEDGLIEPKSVFYNTYTNSVIVGQSNNLKIIVFDVK